MKEIVILLPYPPSVNRVWRHGGGKTYQSKEAIEYKKIAGWLAKQAGAKIFNGNLAIEAILHPKLTKKGKVSQTVLDLDNICKVVLDSFNGVCYIDDKQIKRILLEVGEPKNGGGVTVRIKKL